MRNSPGPQPDHRQAGTGELPAGENSPESLAGQPPNPPAFRRRSRLTCTLGLVSALAIVGALSYVGLQLRQPAPIIPRITLTPNTESRLAAGKPLENDTASIKVLTPPSAASITVLSPSVSAPTITYPTPYNDTPLRLGLTLTLLQQSIANGHPSAQTLANTAATLSSPLEHPDLTQALNLLSRQIPAGGAITLSALLSEAERLQTLGAPNPEPAAGSTTTPTSNTLLHKVITHLVTLKQVDTKAQTSKTEAWITAMNGVRQALALNHADEAFYALSQPPLATDPRLHPLASLVHDYTIAQQQLNAVLLAYAADYLLPSHPTKAEPTP